MLWPNVLGRLKSIKGDTTAVENQHTCGHAPELRLQRLSASSNKDQQGQYFILIQRVKTTIAYLTSMYHYFLILSIPFDIRKLHLYVLIVNGTKLYIHTYVLQ